jgi:hypothetical protein
MELNMADDAKKPDDDLLKQAQRRAAAEAFDRVELIANDLCEELKRLRALPKDAQRQAAIEAFEYLRPAIEMTVGELNGALEKLSQRLKRSE